jgi:nucleotidyltransferase/DNA polymerase involved in DNA repair
VAALPRLASEVLGLDEGSVRGVVVDDPVRSVSVLVDATLAARHEGVEPGMRVLDAQQHAPSLAIDRIAPARLVKERAVVAEVLLQLSPVVEPKDAGVALDLTGLVRAPALVAADVKRATKKLGHACHVVVSPGTALSLAFARVADRDIFVDDVSVALASLPVSALEIPADLAASLIALGAKTASDLARLLPKGGVERLGDAAGAVLDVIEARRIPLSGIRAPEVIVESVDLDHPLTTLEPLAFLLNRLCSRVLARVTARQQRLAELTLSLTGKWTKPSGVVVAFPSPIVDDKAALRSLSVKLERHVLPGPVDRVVLTATKLSERAPRQLDFLDGTSIKAEDALLALLAEMAAELGPERVGCLVVTDDPRPEHMTRLAWPPPPPPPRPPAPKRRRPRPVKESPLTSGGRFLASWPWPLRLLPRPIRFDATVLRKEIIGILEGDVAHGYARRYELLVLADGRRALAILDEEVDETWLCGWFD